jgi:hypothetical protein
MKIGDRVEVFEGDLDDGEPRLGSIVAGPDHLGDYTVRLDGQEDPPWDGWEGIHHGLEPGQYWFVGDSNARVLPS